MTTELEQEFFKVFEIEPTIYSLWDSKETQIKNFKSYEVYPEITDRKLLEMICIFSQHCNFGRWNKYAMHSIDDFEYIMLSQLIEYQKKRYTYGIKEKIQQLFKEAE
jgi:hypothetical protein